MAGTTTRRALQRIAMAVSMAVGLAACASGPADIIDAIATVNQPATTPVLTDEEQAALARDLQSTGAAQESEGRAATGGLPSAMALSIIRQQQEEEARELLEESAANTVAPAAADAPCDPAVDPACAPATQ